ncbi:hypothetical protein [Streptomyces sp. NBC_01285]|nr:hypothetical protein [Streptomyces sp. NBC_01285]MCX4771975.1 hypothetical protein [Streptomyces sp. NBC_01285]
MNAFTSERWVRSVLMPGLTDGPAGVEGVAAFAVSPATQSHADALTP